MKTWGKTKKTPETDFLQPPRETDLPYTIYLFICINKWYKLV